MSNGVNLVIVELELEVGYTARQHISGVTRVDLLHVLFLAIQHHSYNPIRLVCCIGSC
jgi:hypothetical protein